MTKIVVFGAGGRTGRATVEEARRRGHEVTAVLRGQGDVTDADAVAALAQGHDVAVNAAADLRSGTFFADAAGALLDGLARAGVGRLVSVGLASVLDTASGVPLMDTPGYPQEYRAFYLAHAAGTEVLRGSTFDWVVISPAGDFDHEAPSTGAYRTAPADAASRIAQPDFARALLDEIETPKHHRIHLGVEQA
jgi:putative NADH-flavin reductase